jgi:hypothetical protein
MFCTQYTPDFFVEEYYGLRNTTSWGSKDLANGPEFESASPHSLLNGARKYDCVLKTSTGIPLMLV